VLSMKKAANAVREGKAKLLDTDTRTWTNVWLDLHMSDDGSNGAAEPIFVLVAKQDEKVFFFFFFFFFSFSLSRLSLPLQLTKHAAF
jgi:hypothetical protein